MPHSSAVGGDTLMDYTDSGSGIIRRFFQSFTDVIDRESVCRV